MILDVRVWKYVDEATGESKSVDDYFADISPLNGMRLKSLTLYGTKVSDLSPLKGMPLTKLYCNSTSVSDFSPLKEMPLTILSLDFKPERDMEILRSMKTLKNINNKSAAEFWKEVEEQKKEQ